MFELVAKLAEILSSHWVRFLDGRRSGRDAEVAAHVVGVVLALQDLCVRGERLLVLAEELAGDAPGPRTSAEFEGVLADQVREVGALRLKLSDAKPLLATVDPLFYPELAPVVDRKSGLLTRWARQASLSAFSTTTLFFLPSREVASLVDQAGAGAELDRGPYAQAVAEGVRAVRARELRDLRTAAAKGAAIHAEIAAARAGLARTKDFCATLLRATEAAVGREAMTRLRRGLLP